MKADIHPDYHMITVQMTDGSTFQTRSTWGRKATRWSRHRPDQPPGVDRRQPAPARQGGRVAQFNKRFGGLTLRRAEQAECRGKNSLALAARRQAKRQQFRATNGARGDRSSAG